MYFNDAQRERARLHQRVLLDVLLQDRAFLNLLEHALYSLGIPNKLLIFPGEGHELDKNPWHRKIMAREELMWLQKYGGVPTGN
jgi:hypothetical protein